ncbi:metallophosphoesterase [Blastococcus sp. TF02A_35]|uniref:metallophosphoesterase n=1 Tax=Blastococcus sp. TF02A-35 TaxID=2559612 RepID=UPI001073E21B|nr:metallophosphoesterase [Blastococcus sp. TF02A_35]TFV47196.1 metallophosphoesterase [Blastococcus sp. TF02A_35]
MRLLHLSDLHIPRQPGPDTHGVDPRAVLKNLLRDCRRLTDLDLIVVSGDIADDGSPEGCADARDLVGAFARDRSAAQAWCVGNHDDRDAFTAVLGTGHLDAGGRDIGQRAPAAAQVSAATSRTDGLRVITLDSLVPGEVAGRLERVQLEWLRDVLVEPAPAGTVVTFHHPPLSVSPEWAAASLRNPSALADVLRGSDVRAVLCGHVHAQIAGFLAGIPVWVTPGVVTRIDLTAPRGVVRAVRGASATVVDLDDRAGPMFHVLHGRDSDAGAEVYLADGRTWQYLDHEEEPDDARAPTEPTS